MWQFLPLALWPLIEIALFVLIGGAIGLWPTLAWVIGTAVFGSWLIRRQGQRAQFALRHGLAAMSDPVSPAAHGTMLVFAGILLILPGFLTDAIGLLLLLPPVRNMLASPITARFSVRTAGFRGTSTRRPGQPDIIDGEFYEVNTPTTTQVRGPVRTGGSGWTEE